MYQRDRLWIGVLLLLIVILLTGCGAATVSPPTMSPTPHLITFVAFPRATDAGETMIDLGLANAGSQVLPANDAFGAVWQLIGPDQALRAGGRVEQTPLVPSDGQAHILITWRGELEPGAYQLTWGAPGYGATIDQFTVVREGDQSHITDRASHMTPIFPTPTQP